MTTNSGPGRLSFSILGSFKCELDNAEVPLRGPLQERLAVYLLLNHGRVVTVSRLVDAVWDDDGPDTAPHQVRKMISDLRMRIPPLSSQLTTSALGYRLQLEPAWLDLVEFQKQSQQALHPTEGPAEETISRLNRAIQLWRGPVLEGQGGLVINTASTALEERRISVLEKSFELRLTLRRLEGMVAELRDATAQYPMRERLREQLMLALHLSGNRAEALNEFHSIRILLDENYGVDPGPGLSSLFQRLLQDDRSLREDGVASAPNQGIAASPTTLQIAIPTTAPNTLPHVLPDFTGRAQVLQELYTAAGAGETVQAHVRIVVIDGMGGCGKSTLALYAAHRLRGQYPGGQLYVDFKSYTSRSSPLDTHQALGLVLSALGVSDAMIPGDPTARAATWRAVTSGSPILVLIDNAASSQDVSALIPNCPGSLVLVTSRERIPGLDGALSIRLNMFDPPESIELLERILGRERVSEEPVAAAELARLCGYLPLALRISAARLANKTHRSITWLTEQLVDETRRLDVLSNGDRSVTASIRSSDLAMRPDCRRALRLLSLHPGTNFDVFAACSLLGSSEFEAAEILEVLLDYHLLEPRPHGRYGIHDLVRTYANQYQDIEDVVGPAQLDEAIGSLLSYYAVTSNTASNVAFPGRNQYSDRMPSYFGPAPTLTDHKQAIAWFDAEHRTASTLIRTAATRKSHAHVAHISRNLAHYQHLRDHSEEFLEAALLAEHACRAAGSPILLSNALVNLAIAQWKKGDVEKGADLLVESLELAEHTGDLLSQAVCLSRLGALRHTLGENVFAAETLRRALELLTGLGRTREESLTRISLSSTLLDLGRFQEAAQQAQTAADLCRVTRQSHPQVLALADFGKALVHCNRAQEAVDVLTNAHDLSTALRDATSQTALVLANLAEAHIETGQVATAAIYAEQAGELVTLGKSVPALRAGVLNTLGKVHLGLGEHSLSAERYEAALALARASRYTLGEARALAGLAACYDDRTSAKTYRESADAIFDRLEVPATLRTVH